MSVTKKIAHNTMVQIVGKIFSTVLGLVALGMMTRYLGAEQFGWYITTIAFLQFVGILIDFGLIPVTAQMMSEPKFDKIKLF
ncbi:oligosaccharide flippase family protein, partial [Patescibacteria group bacterium]|nr:oligosaccharide flippase family protein [Patescibacteria group bacterium]